MSDSATVEVPGLSVSELLRFNKARQDLREKQNQEIKNLARGITMRDCEAMGSGECRIGNHSRLVPYFDYAPILICLSTAKFSSKRIWQIHEALKRMMALEAGSLSASILVLHQTLKDLSTRYVDLTFRRDENWIVSLRDLQNLAVADPMTVVSSLIRANVTSADGSLNLEIINPYNADVICGFGRVLCKKIYAKNPEERIWKSPIVGHFSHPSSRRKKGDR